VVVKSQENKGAIRAYFTIDVENLRPCNVEIRHLKSAEDEEGELLGNVEIIKGDNKQNRIKRAPNKKKRRRKSLKNQHQMKKDKEQEKEKVAQTAKNEEMNGQEGVEKPKRKEHNHARSKPTDELKKTKNAIKKNKKKRNRTRAKKVKVDKRSIPVVATKATRSLKFPEVTKYKIANKPIALRSQKKEPSLPRLNFKPHLAPPARKPSFGKLKF
jgi:hypothetical protein